MQIEAKKDPKPTPSNRDKHEGFDRDWDWKNPTDPREDYMREKWRDVGSR